jgi:hypothetical protein
MKLIANTPHALNMVCGPKRDEVGRVFANVFAAMARGSVKAMDRAQTPSKKTQFHSAKVTANKALASWLMTSTCPYIIIYLYESKKVKREFVKHQIRRKTIAT